MLKGNQRGRRKISTGMHGTRSQGSCPKRASRILVKTFARRMPPWARIQSRPRTIQGASAGSPAARRAK
jgi:hypothetical protein